MSQFKTDSVLIHLLNTFVCYIIVRQAAIAKIKPSKIYLPHLSLRWCDLFTVLRKVMNYGRLYSLHKTPSVVPLFIKGQTIIKISRFSWWPQNLKSLYNSALFPFWKMVSRPTKLAVFCLLLAVCIHLALSMPSYGMGGFGAGGGGLPGDGFQSGG